MDKNQQLSKLIGELANGNRRAMEELYPLCEKDVYTFALSIVRNVKDAEDVKQDTFIKIMNYADKFKGGNALAWVFTITKNTCLNQIKKRKREVSGEALEGMSITQNFGENKLVLKKALETLSKTERQVTLLYLVSGYKQREIAQLLKLPLTTVKYKYLTALKKLQRSVSLDD